MKYLVALDQGTTSSRAIVFDQNGRTLASHAIEFRQYYPQPGWVEHDPDDILSTQVTALQKAVAMSGVDVADIAASGKPPCFGKRPPAAAYTTPLCGSAAAPHPMWKGCCGKAAAT